MTLATQTRDASPEAPPFVDPQPEILAEAWRLGERGGWLEKARFVARQAYGLLLGPLELAPFCAFRIASVMEPPMLPGKLASMRASAEGREILADQPSLTWDDVLRLRALPAHTLGGAYARYAIDAGLDPNIGVPPPWLGEDERYVFQRGAQTHDLWHLVVDLDTTMAGESAIVAFMCGQQPSLFTLVISLTGLVAGLLENPRGFPTALRSYARGWRTRSLLSVYWERMWELPLDEVRRQLGVEVRPGPVSIQGVAA